MMNDIRSYQYLFHGFTSPNNCFNHYDDTKMHYVTMLHNSMMM